MKHLIAYTLLLLVSGNLLAQTSITGTVRDANGDPLTGANIYLQGTYDGTSSNLEGFFLLESSEIDEQTLCIEV